MNNELSVIFQQKKWHFLLIIYYVFNELYLLYVDFKSTLKFIYKLKLIINKNVTNTFYYNIV